MWLITGDLDFNNKFCLLMEKHFRRLGELPILLWRDRTALYHITHTHLTKDCSSMVGQGAPTAGCACTLWLVICSEVTRLGFLACMLISWVSTWHARPCQCSHCSTVLHRSRHMIPSCEISLGHAEFLPSASFPHSLKLFPKHLIPLHRVSHSKWSRRKYRVGKSLNLRRNVRGV